MLLILPKMKVVHGLILLCINQILNLVDLLICMDNMLTGLLYKILSFTNLMLIAIMNTTTSHIDIFVSLADILQSHEQNLLPSKLVQISQCDVQPKYCD